MHQVKRDRYLMAMVTIAAIAAVTNLVITIIALFTGG